MTIESSLGTHFESPDEQEKNLRWEEAREKVERMQGASGEMVDDGIKETVIGLMAHGVNTVESSEGHIDNREHMDAPYIDIESKDVKEIESRFEKLYGESGENKVAADMLRPEVIRKNLEERAKVFSLIDAFYKDRPTSFDVGLMVEPHKWAASRITNQGAILQALASPEKRAKNLKRYQEEMREFGTFLKGAYFGNKKSRP